MNGLFFCIKKDIFDALVSILQVSILRIFRYSVRLLEMIIL